MRVLIAHSDRDFLMSYKKILEFSGYEADTVFDGTQVFERLKEREYDMVVVEQNIPRVNSRNIIRHLNEEGIPVIAILEHKINSGLLSDYVLANAYLSLPFLPGELLAVIDKVASRTKPGGKIVAGEEQIEIDVQRYRLCGRTRLTNEEISVFEELISGGELSGSGAGICINSLNNKLEALNKKTRIAYRMREGYRLVTNHE